MTQIRGQQQIAFGHQLEPVRDVVVYRAFPFAVRIAAGDAALGLRGRALLVVLSVNLLVIAYPHLHAKLFRVLAWYVDELKWVGHG